MLKNTIGFMNELGKQKIPFLFIIDYEMQSPVVLPLHEIKGEELLYDIHGKTNITEPPEMNEKELIFMKYPISFESYASKFEKLKRHILEGNTYLCNLTCETPIDINLTLKEIFKASKARYKLLYQDHVLVFSPETFISITNGRIFSNPMKGTMDASVENAEKLIMENKKEIAEHYTIVDLIRNDLSMVAKNVRVEQFRYMEKIYTNNKDLLQISSLISGELDNDYPCRIGDILYTLLPAGSICGAPKKRTLEIIKEIEGYHRGFYTGVVGIFDGRNLDCGVMIRFIEKTNNGLVFKSGGGITSFSDAALEYQEMIDKVYVPIVRND